MGTSEYSTANLKSLEVTHGPGCIFFRNQVTDPYSITYPNSITNPDFFAWTVFTLQEKKKGRKERKEVSFNSIYISLYKSNIHL